MAILNVELDSSNLTPVSGLYNFAIDFYDLTTGQLTSDVRFPQGQTFSTSTITYPLDIPVEVADGNYTIGMIGVRVKFKNKTVEMGLFGKQVSCSEDCSAIPITTINTVNSSTYNIVLSSVSVDSYVWKIYNTSQVVMASGTSNVSSNNFNIITPSLPSGKYLFELTGTSCKGKSIKNFNVVTTLPACNRGPNLTSIITSSTSNLQFQFDGDGIFAIRWRIIKDDVVVRDGTIVYEDVAQPGDITYNSSTPIINFSPLSEGNYILEIEGALCSSTPTALGFIIAPVTDQLAFAPGYPTFTPSGGSYAIGIVINRTGLYSTVILNSLTGIYYLNENVYYNSGTPYIKSGLPSGNYIVQVSSISAQVGISGGTPSIGIVGTPTQSCLSTTTVSLNGSSLFGSGGSGSYQWAIIKTIDFVNTSSLSWSNTKVWTVDHSSSYRIYVRDIPIDGVSTNTFITVTTQNCNEDEDLIFDFSFSQDL